MKIISSIFLFFIISSVHAQRVPDENFLKGIAYYEQEKYDSAIHFLSVSEEEMNSSELYYFRGLSFFETGQLNEALDDFFQVEESDGGKAAFLISRIYARKNDLKNSLNYLEQNLKSRYKKPESEIMLNEDLARFENNKEWIQFWRENKYYTPYDRTIAEAKYMSKRGDHLDAINILSEALKDGYRPSPVKAVRAEIYIKLEDYRLALSDLNDAVSGDRRNAELYYLRGKVNQKLGNNSDAVEDYSNALKYSPERIRIYSLRSMAYHKSGNYENAIIDMNVYLSYFPDDHQSWYNYGIIHSENRKYFDALRCLNKALSLNRNVAEYYVLRGKTYFQTNTPKYARNDFSMALDLDPHNATAYLFKGRSALKLGLRNEACFCFEKAFELGIFEAKELIEKTCK